MNQGWQEARDKTFSPMMLNASFKTLPQVQVHFVIHPSSTDRHACCSTSCLHIEFAT